MQFNESDYLSSLGISIGPFPEWNASSLPVPCLPLDHAWKQPATQTSPATTGILFVKTPKTASSTAASVTLRLAYSAAAKRNNNNHDLLCRNRIKHFAHEMNYLNRDKRSSLLWSMVRDPTSRAISEYFHFRVSRQHVEPSDDDFMAYVKRKRQALTSLQLQYLALRENVNDDPAQVIQEIFREYNFIGVTERFDESVVVLQMLLRLEPLDTMYLSSKSSGGFDDGRSNGGQCVRIRGTVVSHKMTEYLESDEWKSIIHWDEVLHKAANHALDLRIEQLGRDEFQRHLATFQAMRQRVEATCANKVRLPCSSTGVKRTAKDTDCLLNDMGCGFDCMDSIDWENATVDDVIL
ncbi:hypothetical protein MPSEU_000262000 [Mayamaea pseudoterrestris]|nr:hypothetical protein MPSEU_000262000 [Mayamaea pseudoterrestris]